MSEFMCSDCGEAYMYCACEENPLNSDKLSLDGSGGVTRRMTDKERIQELEKQLAESVPKSEKDSLVIKQSHLDKKLQAISEYLVIHKNKSNWVAVHNSIEELLTPPAKENE